MRHILHVLHVLHVHSTLNEGLRPAPAHVPRLPRPRLLVLLALAGALLLQGWIPRDAGACGDHEIDYGPEEPVVTAHRGYSEIRLNYRRKEHSFAGGNYNFSELRVFTRDAGLLAWLGKDGMGEAMWKRLKESSATATCAALMDGRALARLETKLATEVAAQYRRTTGRSVPRPDLALVAEVPDDSGAYCNPPLPTR